MGAKPIPPSIIPYSLSIPPLRSVPLAESETLESGVSRDPNSKTFSPADESPEANCKKF
jgi:hypothetical protein